MRFGELTNANKFCNQIEQLEMKNIHKNTNK